MNSRATNRLTTSWKRSTTSISGSNVSSELKKSMTGDNMDEEYFDWIDENTVSCGGVVVKRKGDKAEIAEVKGCFDYDAVIVDGKTVRDMLTLLF